MGRARVGVALLLLGLIWAACGATQATTGIVTSVAGDLETVEAFTMLTTHGEAVTLTVDASTRWEFPPPHLQEHLRSGEPIYVEWTDDDVAVFVSDG